MYQPKDAEVPATYTPGFLAGMDQRRRSVRRALARVDELLTELSKTERITPQRGFLIERLAWLELVCEGMELAISKGDLSVQGQYVQACNAALGIARELGLAPIVNTGEPLPPNFMADFGKWPAS